MGKNTNVLGWLIGLALLAASLGGVSLIAMNGGITAEPLTLIAGVVAVAAAAAALTLMILAQWRAAWVLIALAVVAAVALVGSRYAAGGSASAPPATTAVAPKHPAMLLDGVQPWPGGVVPVCWVRPETSPADQAIFEAATHDAEKAWERAAGVTFQDLGACRDGIKAVALTGVRDGENPETPTLGAALLGAPTPVKLGFGFASRSSCNRAEDPDVLEACVHGEAVHELGHVLGLPDIAYSAAAPADCKALMRGDHPPLAIPYRAASAMNVCDGRHRFGRISDSDVADLREIYGPPK